VRRRERGGDLGLLEKNHRGLGDNRHGGGGKEDNDEARQNA